jgi:hypothetical protein
MWTTSDLMIIAATSDPSPLDDDRRPIAQGLMTTTMIRTR